MANFQYRAIDAQGKPVEGETTALDLSQLESRLQDMGLWLVRAIETKHTVRRLPKMGKVKSRDIIEFCRHMFNLLEAGIPLAQALKSLSQETSNLHLRTTLQTVYQQVEAGNTLHEAMAQFPEIFPTQATNLVQAGEKSDTLIETFKELERYLEWLDQIRGDFRQAMTYPSIVIVAVMGLLVLLLTFVIPRFVPILNDLQVPLPTITVVIIGISEFMVDTWWIWSSLVLAISLLWLFGEKYIAGFSNWRDRIILRLPVLGALIQMLTLSKFVQNFAVLYTAGVPVLECLQLCRGLVGNHVFERALQNTQRAVAEGATIHESLSRHQIFPPMVIQMISIGETTGNLSKTLLNVANFYNREIPRRVKKIFAILEPVITLGLIGIVGIVALALFLPMLSLIGGLR